MEIAEDPMAGSNDRRGFPLHEVAECLAVTPEDGIDRPADVKVRGRSDGWALEVSCDRFDSR